MSSSDLVWTFGYGSLMWRPGFEPDAFETARLVGFQRRLCIRSEHYRGTCEQPGVVMGLTEGGSCIGRAIGFRAERADEIMAYLDARELVTNVYDRRLVPVELLDSGRIVDAWAYVARPDHDQYIGNADDEVILAMIRQGCGTSGTCQEYLENTLDHLDEMGIDEPSLRSLAQQLLKDELPVKPD
ncbi:MAG TPA: gamma-glutamylcyclotransferase [Geminicoccus sp.]|jgi:cation transport protein ChaC|uniref:gamma-glutamylcyclotransferase n=1 Tax=Geminicoccus sp. TaxID=2024832 RepID=UPI002E3791A1|nr:gamma-glutamylcyclotransferase [Geminicoccus sp.]HEX2528467.1 gamma-glutamylcyclotransferase [Geminicoccus sp.]